jgi:RND family efflux transporter MFP subunit
MTILDLAARRKATSVDAAPPVARRRRRIWLWPLAGLAALALSAGGGWMLLQPVPVSTAPVVTGEAVDAVYASGVVEYVRQARIAPVVSAPIRRVLVEEGDDVRAGQPLAQLDDGPQEGVVLQLEAQAALARATADRQRRLDAAGFGARAALEDAEKLQAAAAAAARGARARLADYRLVAPFAGRVIRREAEPGDLAQVGQPMFVVADTGALRIRADIDERDVGRLAVGQDAVVRSDSFPGQTFPARIREITPQGDSAGRVFRARLTLSPDTVLKPGMTVESNLVTGRRPSAVLAPTKALKDGAVWVVADGRAHRRVVRVGAQGADRIEIISGLKAGEAVIVDPPARLKDGARVKAGA